MLEETVTKGGRGTVKVRVESGRDDKEFVVRFGKRLTTRVLSLEDKRGGWRRDETGHQRSG